MTRSFRLKLILIAYLPTLIILGFILLMLLAYFTGWRVWIVQPTEIPTPTLPMGVT